MYSGTPASLDAWIARRPSARSGPMVRRLPGPARERRSPRRRATRRAPSPRSRSATTSSAQYRLVSEHLEIERLALVLGFSMGAQQAYEWAVRFPDARPPARGLRRAGANDAGERASGLSIGGGAAYGRPGPARALLGGNRPLRRALPAGGLARGGLRVRARIWFDGCSRRTSRASTLPTSSASSRSGVGADVSRHTPAATLARRSAASRLGRSSSRSRTTRCSRWPTARPSSGSFATASFASSRACGGTTPGG